MLFVTSSARAADCTGADTIPTAQSMAAAGAATLCLLNEERVQAGLNPVAEHATLTSASVAYAERLVRDRFFAHVAPDGSTVTDRLGAAGYLPASGDWAVGENLAWGQDALATPRNIVAAWMASAGHRANILDGDFTEVGVGIVGGTPVDAARGATYTTEYGMRAGAAAAPVAATRSAARSARPAATPRPGTKRATRMRRCTRRRVQNRRTVCARAARWVARKTGA
jgi:uncharacterized protein YkwD